ncbi:hypothetical protein O181_062769 [Austropuccinia psidii MF-1]|uniref:Integrase catalytic domain-containing protein n=1 Tax=Austropuccinia psidii MF-1 TaxID=1389203 RepID=A0A9Q3EL19_9BASI|nr:hypothetical protein [Austropuccinia psidii MF-1]
MIGTKYAFSTSQNQKKEILAERMIQTMQDVMRRFCAYGIESKYDEGDTHDWVTLQPAIQLAYNTSQHSTTGKSPSLLGKLWNPAFPVDHLNKNLLTIHLKPKDFHDMWNMACDRAAICIANAKE